MQNAGYEAVRAHLLREGRVLLALSRSRSLWTTLGGKLEVTETPEQALRRELLEELGIVPTAVRRLADRVTNWDGAAALIAVYAVTSWEGTETNLALHEHEQIAWFGADELVGLPLTPAAGSEALALLGPDNPQLRAYHLRT